MSEFVTLYTSETLTEYLTLRPGETKFGERVGTLSHWEALPEHPAKYVLLGIPEDIGVRANYGIGGTAGAWQAGLKALLNIQHNGYTGAASLLVLGEIDCRRQLEQAAEVEETNLHRFERWGALVQQVDEKVTAAVRAIVSAGKVPILIGGGHNNSYGNLRGTSEALGAAVNCINLDAHSDYRPLEHRHSGNGFSYAAEGGYLDRYYMLGLHRNYTSQALFGTFELEKEAIRFSMFEDIVVTRTKSFGEALTEAERFCAMAPFGLELDMDAIAGMGSSALSPCGFPLEQARRFVDHFSRHEHCRYVHICEGAPNREAYANQVGKAIAYLVSDVVSLF